MRHFLRLAENIDVLPILHELKVNADLWDQNALRTTHHLSPHNDVSDIWLWFNELKEDVAEAIDDLQTYPYAAWSRLPTLRRLVLDLMHRVDGVQLGRCIVTKLPPGGIIDPHVDQGSPAEFYSRYQIALQSLPGALFKIEDEVVNFKSGEVWWINNRAEHAVLNNSADERIVCIVDIKSC